MAYHSVSDGLQRHEGLPADSGMGSAPPRRYRRTSNPAHVWGEEAHDEEAYSGDAMLPDYWSVEDQQQMLRMGASRGSSNSSEKSGYEEASFGSSLLRMVGSFGSSIGTYCFNLADALVADAGNSEFTKGAASAFLLQGGPGFVQGKPWLGVGTSADVDLKKAL